MWNVEEIQEIVSYNDLECSIRLLLNKCVWKNNKLLLPLKQEEKKVILAIMKSEGVRKVILELKGMDTQVSLLLTHQSAEMQI